MVFAVTCGFASSLRLSSQTTQEPTPAAVRPAAQAYEESGCSHCHIFNGAGGRKGPNLSGVGKRLSVEAIAKQIREGGGAMPAYGEALDGREITRLAEMLSQARK